MTKDGLAHNIKAAQSLVRAGKVIVDDQRIDLPSTLVQENASIRIRGTKKFVGRGAEKLLPALRHYNLEDVINSGIILDAGASTGGFTQICLQLGAKEVVALDVGTNQLDWSLRSNPQVTSLEKTDIRDYCPDRNFNLIVCDLSFISLKKIIPPMVAKHQRIGTLFLFLVKPQFELPANKIPPGGVITNIEDRKASVEEIFQTLKAEGLFLKKPFDCPILGRNGNQETFILAERVRG